MQQLTKWAPSVGENKSQMVAEQSQLHIRWLEDGYDLMLSNGTYVVWGGLLSMPG